MSGTKLNPGQVAALSALANGIIPASETDAGAAAVNAGPRLAEMIAAGTNVAVYLRGLELAETVSRELYSRGVAGLTPTEIHTLLGAIRERLPGFFKQLRMDVSALYLSDPAVWLRIGFPGPSTASGGYPDFDQPQTEKIISLKEPHERRQNPPGSGSISGETRQDAYRQSTFRSRQRRMDRSR